MPLLLGEPQRTRYDLHFELFGIPVRVHPLFWLMALILGLYGTTGGEHDAIIILSWVSAVFVSILIHEFGHAFTMRHFGDSPSVVLYMMGGLAIPSGARSSWNIGKQSHSRFQQILVLAAGPGAGFLFAAVICAVVVAAGGNVAVRMFVFLHADGLNNLPLRILVNDLLLINIFWGLVNLLPVYPLDGGQIAREVMTGADPWNGIRRSLWLSVITGGGIAVLGLALLNSILMAVMFGSLAFSSYQALQSLDGRGGGYGGGRPW